MQALGKAPFVEFISAEALERKMNGAGFKIIEKADQVGLFASHYIVARKS